MGRITCCTNLTAHSERRELVPEGGPLRVLAHANNASTREADAGRSTIAGRSETQQLQYAALI